MVNSISTFILVIIRRLFFSDLSVEVVFKIMDFNRYHQISSVTLAIVTS